MNNNDKNTQLEIKREREEIRSVNLQVVDRRSFRNFFKFFKSTKK